jgi:membrane protein
MSERLDALIAFLKTGIWVLPEKDLSRPKAIFVRTLKVLLLALRGFQRDQCAVKASALTFYSLLSIVPIVAVFFGISKGFGFDKKLQAQLLLKFPAQTDVLLKVFEFSNALLQKTKGGIVAGIGVALLFWSVIKVLGYIEDSFNDIWRVEHSRTIGRRLSDYLSVALVCPLIFVMASSVTVTVAGAVKAIAVKASEWGLPPGPILVLLKVIPFLLIWVLFTFLFVFMPNTKVRLRSGFLAAVTAGTAYQLIQWVYIAFQVGVARNNAIYGSFAALPLFLAWTQLSWVVVLLGSEISFAVQNVDTHGFPEGSEKISAYHGKILSLLIARLVVRNFSEGERPLAPSTIADVLGMPPLLVHRILSDLCTVGLFSATQGGGGEFACQPAQDIHKIRVKTVVDALERCGSVELPFSSTGGFQAVSGILDAFGQAVEKSPENKLLLDL